LAGQALPGTRDVRENGASVGIMALLECKDEQEQLEVLDATG
jgi:hypothetical protein